MNRPYRRAALGLIAAVLVSLTGCSTKGADASSAKDSAHGVKTGPGVTDSTITLGVLTDLSGPVAPLGKSSLQAQQLYLDQVNKAGGVCGRKIKLLVRDHGYDVQKAVASYAEIQPRIAAMGQLLGSGQSAALLDSVERDKLLSFVGGNSASLLGHPHVQLIGTTYGIEMVNGMGFLVKAAKLAKGDKVGMVYQDGDYGGNAAAGARFAAKKAGIRLVEQTIKPTDTDMTAQVTALKAAHVKAIAFSGTPAQTASLVGVAAASGLTVPVLGSSPSFVPQLLSTPAKPALEKMLFIASSQPSLDSDIPGVRKLVADYRAKYPKEKLNQAVEIGEVNARLATETLKAACRAKDLSRTGISSALRTLKQFDNGLGSTQDYSDSQKAPSEKTYVLQPSSTVTGGLKTVQDAATSPDLAEFLKTAKG
ncbi:ABC transporter substrate-binding protein [Streptomyces sp. AcE210]|uniref:ABC transporter substrate-binding protein n=1 Tax=Streptomyces sp. AcE210 TaxID=2292703 RepID=UPI000E3060F5|nr:ABC transporter substrate-binding protein [Streptomyces sp. AcE210]RFC70672.1 ABC transporter substrate-binding protein [Streptomyces sp. AcE210]